MPLLANENPNSIQDEYRKAQEKKFPYEITYVESEINSQLMKDFTGERTGFVQVGPKKWLFPSGYIKEAANFYNFEFRKDDVVVATYPRSGTTLTQEMVWLLCNEFNYQKASEIPLTQRVPFLDFNILFHEDTIQEFLVKNRADPDKYKTVQEVYYPVWKTLSNLTGRRFIKTHLPFDLLPPNLMKIGCKIIYVARNPKDVAVSYYHLNRTMRMAGYTGDFRKFWDYFERNLIKWNPYWEHIKEGWSRRHEENVLFMFYEDIVKDLKGSIEKVATFLEKFCTTEELETLENHLKFDNFQRNKSVNMERFNGLGIARESEASFVRKGQIGGWKEYFDLELEKRADKWIEKNLEDTDLRFPV